PILLNDSERGISGAVVRDNNLPWLWPGLPGKCLQLRRDGISLVVAGNDTLSFIEASGSGNFQRSRPGRNHHWPEQPTVFSDYSSCIRTGHAGFGDSTKMSQNHVKPLRLLIILVSTSTG